MTTDTRTLRDLIAVLAGDVECPDGRILSKELPSGYMESPKTHADCATCSGTGRVPRFQKDGQALFRVPCPLLNDDPDTKQPYSLHVADRCPGWLPLPEADLHLETLLDAAHSQGWRFDFKQMYNGVLRFWLFISVDRPQIEVQQPFYGEGMIGAARALYAAEAGT